MPVAISTTPSQQFREYLTSLGLDEAVATKVCEARRTATIAHFQAFCEFADKSLGMNASDVLRVLSLHPHIITQNIDKVNVRVDFFQSQLDIKDREKLKELFLRVPRLFSCSVDNSLAPKMSYLRDELKLTQLETLKLFATNGYLCSVSLENTLRPAINILANEMEIPIDRLRKMIVCHPPIVTRPPSKLQSAIKFFLEDLKIPKPILRTMIMTHGSILRFSVPNNLVPTIDFFTKQIGLTQDDLRAILQLVPQVFCLSVQKNLEPKLSYLLNEIGMSKERIKEEIIDVPYTLAFSLEQRIRPRHRLLVSLNKFPENFNASSSSRLYRVLSLADTNVKFCEVHGVALSKLEALVNAAEKKHPIWG
eukprot:c7103_g1_i1.p1 GENE.c7103_g1_i1~~c7103_g1_i1.p1  ORF type:complete len:405 (-),score=85.87 c7103_g1_i1:348-1442(-)